MTHISYHRPDDEDELNEYIDVETDRCLGVIFFSDLRWDSHIDFVCRKASSHLYILRKMKRCVCVPKDDLMKIYFAYILNIMEYNSPVFVGLSKSNSDKLEKLRKRCHRIVCSFECHCSRFVPLETRRVNHALKIFRQMLKPDHLLNYLCLQFLPRSQKLSIPFSRTNRRLSSFIPRCSVFFNDNFSNDVI